MHEIDVGRLNKQFEGSTPQEILQWASETFERSIAATSSFQTQSVPLLHLIAKGAPQIPVLFLDTGFHFPETLEFRDHLKAELGLDVRSLKTKIGHDSFRQKHGELHRRNPDLCCHLNKVEPLERALEGYQAWISGVRRDQTKARSNTPVFSQLENGIYKICPMVSWTSKDIWWYMNEHDLPDHPLFSEGYFSIGCAPCTRRPGSGGDERNGRWAGREKTECGIHTELGRDDEHTA